MFHFLDVEMKNNLQNKKCLLLINLVVNSYFITNLPSLVLKTIRKSACLGTEYETDGGRTLVNDSLL